MQQQTVVLKTILPQTCGYALHDQVQVLLGRVTLCLAGSKLLAHGQHITGHVVQLLNIRRGTLWMPYAATDLPQHLTNVTDGTAQPFAERAGTDPHEREEPEIEHHQPDNHQIADVAVVAGQVVGRGHDLPLVGNRQQTPAGWMYFTPGDQVRPAAQRHLGIAAALPGERPHKVIEIRSLRQAEIVRPQVIALQCFQRVLRGGLTQREFMLCIRRQRHDLHVAADQHQVAAPRHLELADLIEDAAHRNIQAHNAFEEVSCVDRLDRRHHPTMPCRVKVDIGPASSALRITCGIGKVVKVVPWNLHIMWVLLVSANPGVDAVVAVPTIEVDARHQRLVTLDFAHQRVKLCQSPDLAQVLARRGRYRRVEGRRST